MMKIDKNRADNSGWGFDYFALLFRCEQ